MEVFSWYGLVLLLFLSPSALPSMKIRGVPLWSHHVDTVGVCTRSTTTYNGLRVLPIEGANIRNTFFFVDFKFIVLHLYVLTFKSSCRINKSILQTFFQLLKYIFTHFPLCSFLPRICSASLLNSDKKKNKSPIRTIIYQNI